MNWRNLLLIVLVFLGFFLRVYKITEIPPSLNWDEASIGYNAYSILKTSKDEWGIRFPLHFQSFGEYKLPAQIYASIPAIAILGLTPFSVRITPVIYGTLTVLLLYLLTQELFKRRSISLVSSLLLAISPWHIQLTRASFESSFSVFWVLMGLWFLAKGLNGKKWWWIISAIPFGISVYTYNSARVFTPLFLGVVALICFKRFWADRKHAIAAGLLFVLFLIPLIPFVLSGKASARYKLVSITNEEGLVPRINERRGQSTLPYPLPRLIHNKVTYITYYFAKNYLAHFSPDFLFISGAEHRQHHAQGVGELYKIQAPFLLIGLYFLFSRKEKHRWILLAWLLLSFVPVATTKDSIPNALRTLIAAPFFEMISAYGFFEILKVLDKKKRIIIVILSTLILICEMGLYLKNYYTTYAIKYSRDWQYGYKQVMAYVSKHYREYDEIVITRYYGEPHMFTLFYLSFPPDRFQNDKNLVRYKAFDWVWVTNFDKFYFPNLSDLDTRYADIVDKNKGKRILFVGKSGDFPENVEKLYTVDYLNGERAFEIVESK